MIHVLPYRHSPPAAFFNYANSLAHTHTFLKLFWMCKGKNKHEKLLSNSVSFLSGALLSELEVLQETELNFKTDCSSTECFISSEYQWMLSGFDRQKLESIVTFECFFSDNDSGNFIACASWVTDSSWILWLPRNSKGRLSVLMPVQRSQSKSTPAAHLPKAWKLDTVIAKANMSFLNLLLCQHGTLTGVFGEIEKLFWLLKVTELKHYFLKNDSVH